MMITWILVILFAASFALPICGSGTRPIGAIYADVSDPVAATTNAGAHTGEVTSTSYLVLVATGDSSIDTAKRVGGITTVSRVDVKSNNILDIISQYTTIVKDH